MKENQNRDDIPAGFIPASDVLNSIFGELKESELVDYDFYNVLGEFSIALVTYRINHQMTQQQLAEKLEISRHMLSRYEEGSKAVPLRDMMKVCRKLGISMNVSFTQPNG